MAEFIRFIITLLVDGYDFIKKAILFISEAYNFVVLQFMFNPLTATISTILPLGIVIVVIKFILKGGK